MKLNLIWQTKKGIETEFEFEHITEVLFKDFDTNYIFDEGSLSTVMNNAVIIYSNDTKNVSPKFLNYLDKFIDQNFNLYLVHLSNENLNHNCWYYGKANYVFRNYYSPLIENPNVLFIPLGFKSGFLRRNELLNDCNDRNFGAVFIGQPKGERFELVQEIKKLKNYYLHETKVFNCVTNLSQVECIEIYQHTRFVPCPAGNINPDTFRVCESLEWGCIPIVKLVDGKDYFRNIFGDHPFRIVSDWSEIGAVVKQQSDFCTDSAFVQAWYSDFKQSLRVSIKDIINSGGLPPDTKTYFFQYARCVLFDAKIKLKAFAKLILQ